MEAAAARCSELEADIVQSVEEGVRAAKDEVAAVQRRLEEEAKVTSKAKEALVTARADLEKARRELKQRGQRARSLLADKDAEINRLRSGGGGGLSGGGLDVSGEELEGFSGQQGGVSSRRESSGSVDGASSPPFDGSRRRATSSGSPSDPLAIGSLHGGGGTGGEGAAAAAGAGGSGAGGVPDETSPAFGNIADGGSGSGGRKRLQGGAGGGGGGSNVTQLSAAESHHAEQQILQMARVQAQRDEETGRLRVKIQLLSDEIQAREERLSARDEEKDRLRRRVEELQGEATRAKELLDQEHGPEKMTYLKNVVKRFVVSDAKEKQRLVPVVATILSFSPAETSEVGKAVAAATSGGSSWGSVFGGS